MIAAPCTCQACGGTRLSRISENVTATLEVIPRQWKVIQTVREKVACRDCDKISLPPSPFHVVARGWAGPGLLAMMLFEKYGQHRPLNRQVERYGREGVPLSLSTLADQVGAAAAVLKPMHHRLRAHVMGAERLHGDDTTAPIVEAGCWSHARRAFLVLADLEASARRKADSKKPAPISPLALEIVQRMDRLFEVERSINGRSSQDWLADVLARITDLPSHQLDELLPWNWAVSLDRRAA